MSSETQAICMKFVKLMDKFNKNPKNKTHLKRYLRCLNELDEEDMRIIVAFLHIKATKVGDSFDFEINPQPVYICDAFAIVIKRAKFDYT